MTDRSGKAMHSHKQRNPDPPPHAHGPLPHGRPGDLVLGAVGFGLLILAMLVGVAVAAWVMAGLT